MKFAEFEFNIVEPMLVAIVTAAILRGYSVLTFEVTLERCVRISLAVFDWQVALPGICSFRCSKIERVPADLFFLMFQNVRVPADFLLAPSQFWNIGKNRYRVGQLAS